MMTEQISGTGHEADPNRRTQKVEKRKCSPAHAQHSGQRPGESPHAEDEAGKENGGCPVAGKHFLAALQRGWRNPKNALIAIEQRTSAIVAESVTEITAERGGNGGNYDDPAESELVFGIGQKTSHQERDLTGNWDAGALRQQGQSHGPVAVVGNECAQRMKSRGVHEETSCRFPVLSQNRSSAN